MGGFRSYQSPEAFQKAQAMCDRALDPERAELERVLATVGEVVKNVIDGGHKLAIIKRKDLKKLRRLVATKEAS